MATHPTLLVAELHFDTRRGIAHWVSVVPRKQYDEWKQIKTGVLDLCEYFGDATSSKYYYRTVDTVIGYLRMVSDTRNDVMAWTHALSSLGRPYVGNVDLPTALEATQQQNREEQRERDGDSIDSEPEDGDYTMSRRAMLCPCVRDEIVDSDVNSSDLEENDDGLEPDTESCCSDSDDDSIVVSDREDSPSPGDKRPSEAPNSRRKRIMAHDSDDE